MKILKIKEVEDSVKILKSLIKEITTGHFGNTTVGGSYTPVSAYGNFADRINKRSDSMKLLIFYEKYNKEVLNFSKTLSDSDRAEFIRNHPHPQIYFDSPQKDAYGKFKTSLSKIAQMYLNMNSKDITDGLNQIKDYSNFTNSDIIKRITSKKPIEFVKAYLEAHQGSGSTVDQKNMFETMIKNYSNNINNSKYILAYRKLHEMYIEKYPEGGDEHASDDTTEVEIFYKESKNEIIEFSKSLDDKAKAEFILKYPNPEIYFNNIKKDNFVNGKFSDDNNSINDKLKDINNFEDFIKSEEIKKIVSDNPLEFIKGYLDSFSYSGSIDDAFKYMIDNYPNNLDTYPEAYDEFKKMYEESKK